MEKNQVRVLSYMALYAALCLALQVTAQFIPFLQMPNGGSIELGYVALFIASYHLGWKRGVAVGLLWWLLGCLFGLNSYFLNPMQYLLDYLVPVVVCGMVALLSAHGSKGEVLGICISMLLKYLSNLLSGVYYWPPKGAAAGSQAAWIFSLGYNAWYNLATMAVCIILVPLLLQRLPKGRNSFVGLK